MARRVRFGASRGRLTVAKLLGVDVMLRFEPGADVVAQELERRLQKLRNLQPVMEQYGQYLVEQHISLQFKLGGTPEKWAPLSPGYAEYKRRRYGRLPILVLSGRMRAGFSYHAGKRSLRVENPRQYWFYHQFGTKRMPARPMLQLRDRDRYVLRRLLIIYAWES